MIFIVFRDSFLLSIKLHIGIFAAVAILVVYFPFVDSTEDDPQGGQVHRAAGLLLQNMQRARSKVRISPIQQLQLLHQKGIFFRSLWRGNLYNVFHFIPTQVLGFALKEAFKPIFMPEEVDKEKEFW